MCATAKNDPQSKPQVLRSFREANANLWTIRPLSVGWKALMKSSTETQPTGKRYAGKPAVRFGERGRGVPVSPYPYQTSELSRRVLHKPLNVFQIAGKAVILRLPHRYDRCSMPLVDFRMTISEGEATSPIVIARGQIHEP